MNSQQAASTLAQAFGDGPFQTASMKAHRTKSGIVRASQIRTASVTAQLSGVDTLRRTKLSASMSALDAQHAAVRQIAGARNRKIDQKIAHHRHAHDLERLTGLVQSRPGENEHEIGITYRGSERRILEDADVLAHQRRKDGANHLRDDDRGVDASSRQPERHAGFSLPFADSRNAAADQLRDE